MILYICSNLFFQSDERGTQLDNIRMTLHTFYTTLHLYTFYTFYTTLHLILSLRPIRLLLSPSLYVLYDSPSLYVLYVLYDSPSLSLSTSYTTPPLSLSIHSIRLSISLYVLYDSPSLPLYTFYTTLHLSLYVLYDSPSLYVTR
jgi:hypothetical protein